MMAVLGETYSVKSKLVSLSKRSLLGKEVKAVLKRLILLMLAVAVVHSSNTDTLSKLLVDEILDLVGVVEAESVTANLVEPVELPLQVAEGSVVLNVLD
jgi:hypothetical protein